MNYACYSLDDTHMRAALCIKYVPPLAGRILYMAQRRMFSPDIVNTDAFLEMPPSSQCLYFHLALKADDDGFVHPKMVMRLVNSGEDDLKVLLAKRYVLKFESGVVVIKHWLIHNLIRADLYKETLYLEEKSTLGLKDNGSYTELRDGISTLKRIEAPEWLKRRRGEPRVVDVPFAYRKRTDSVPEAALRLGKVRLGKVRLEREEESTHTKSPNTEKTPAQVAREFFSGGEGYKTTLDEILVKYPDASRDFIENEFKKFILYWTEPNKSGTKVRWEQQPTFDVKRRIYTWLGNIKEHGRFRGRGIVSSV